MSYVAFDASLKLEPASQCFWLFPDNMFLLAVLL